MRACQALGDRPGALRLYHALEQRLRTDLDLAPRADLEALAAALRAA
jgi:DNA-binding SARP family transcriptional activator